MRKLVLTPTLALVLALTAGACAKSVTPTAEGPTRPPPTSTPTVTLSPPPLKTVKIYYLVSFGSKMWLAPERHQIPSTRAIAKAALDELVHGTAQDPDHSTPYPPSATINSVTISGGVATVDWSADVLAAGVGASVEALGIQSVVYTLTEFSSISRVRFTVEGKTRGSASNGRTIEDWWGHAGLAGQPWKRDAAIDVLEPITLYTPANGSSSSGALALTGEASTFEANVGIVLRNAAGKVIVQTSTTASIGAPERGRFSKTITFTPPTTRQTWTLQVIEDSAEDGSILFMENRSIMVG